MTMVNHTLKAFGLLGIITLSACGAGSSNNASTDTGQDQGEGEVSRVSITGVAVKGPLAVATVSVYELDLSAADLKGSLVTSGQTGSTSFIDNMEIATSLSGKKLLVEFSSSDATIDINTNTAPLVSTFTTVIEADDLIAGSPAYASPLTTMAVELARLNADTSRSDYQGNGDSLISDQEFDTALDIAVKEVLSTLGLGWNIDADLLNTPPLVTATSATNEALMRVLWCRQSIEGVIVIINDIAVNLLDNGATAQDVFNVMALDLTDGTIDGQSSTGAIPLYQGISVNDLQAAVQQDVTNQLIPGTSTTVGNIETLLVSETSVTRVDQSTTSLSNGTVSTSPEQAQVKADINGDDSPASEM